jgi:hypothetical protein
VGVGGTAVVLEGTKQGVGVLFVGGLGEGAAVVGALMLLPCEEITPPNCAALQFSIEFPATMVFFTKMAAPSWVMIPPPNRADSLLAIIEFSMFIVAVSLRAAEKTPPLNPVVLLPLIVVLVMLAVPLNWTTPAWLTNCQRPCCL